MRIAVIPAYEPDELMLQLLHELQQLDFSVLVVDDGSGERYAALFREAETAAQVIGYEKNQGKGHALKTAFAEAAKHCGPEDTVVVLDCDGQHRAADAVRLCEEAEKAPDTLILGSRLQDSGSPLRSRFGNAATRKVYRRVTGLNVYDTQTGMRAFSASLLPVMTAIPGERYEYEMNVLLTFAREKRPMREIPIETIYLDKNRRSHFNTLRDSWRVYKQILKFSASSFTGFLTDYLLFSLLTIATGGAVPILCNVGARLVSAAVNFSLNRWVVFKDHNPIWKSAAQYFALAAGILVCNSAILWLLAEVIGLNQFIAKLLTEMILFICSWLVQSKLIFRNKHQTENGGGTHETPLEQ